MNNACTRHRDLTQQILWHRWISCLACVIKDYTVGKLFFFFFTVYGQTNYNMKNCSDYKPQCKLYLEEKKKEDLLLAHQHVMLWALLRHVILDVMCCKDK